MSGRRSASVFALHPRGTGPFTTGIGRREAGASVAIELDVSLHRSSLYYVGFTERLSTDSCFVATHEVAPVGTRLELTLHLPPPGAPIRLFAEVRWQRAPDPARNVPPGLGLKFLALEADGANALAELIAATPRVTR